MGNLTTVNYNIERKIKENFDNEAYINKETQNLKYKPIEEEYANKGNIKGMPIGKRDKSRYFI